MLIMMNLCRNKMWPRNRKSSKVIKKGNLRLIFRRRASQERMEIEEVLKEY